MSIEFTFVPGAGRNAAAFFFDPASSRRQLALVEEMGFGHVVVDDPGGALANFDIAASAAGATSALQIVLTHWAGVIAPAVAARQLAALHAKTGGRLSLRILPDGEAGCDNADVTHRGHVATFQRSDEYLMLLKRLWSNSQPFDFEGAFHSIRGGFVPVKGSAREMPFRMGGNSGTAIQVGARHADVFELSPGLVGDVRHQIERVRNAAVRYGRSEEISFALPVRFGSGVKAGIPLSGRTGAAGDGAAHIAVSLLPYVEAGVSEFMMSGVDDGEAMRLFRDVVTVLLNSVKRSEAVDGWPVIRSHEGAAHRGRHATTS